jgi:hypothetical protein
MMNTYRYILMFLVLAALTGCAANYSKQQVLASGSQVEMRSYQTRTYDTDNKIRVLRAVMSTLQDLGFVIDKADDVIGIVSATKLDRYNLSMSISVRPSGQQMIVRANAQYNLTAIEDPGPYQDFFTSLDKGLFLDDNLLANSASTQNTRVEASKNLETDIGEDAFAFYGQAEKEITAGTYDANLWAKAFVLVEGDEQKRKAKYIELRAYQLYNENAATTPAKKQTTAVVKNILPVLPPAVDQSSFKDDISGIWKSNITGGEIRNRNRVITFKQTGNNISGTWDTDPFHKITGVREGDTIKFDWIEGSATGNEGRWKISPDGFKMEGRWTHIDGIRSGIFDLSRIE